MTGLRDEIYMTLQDTAQVIKGNMQARGINASGRTSNAIHARMNGDKVQLVKDSGKVAPMSTLEIGRPGGKVPRGFYYIIKQWTRDKGLQFDTETERGTFAYFLARKIARDGTSRQRHPVDVYSPPVNEAKKKIIQILTDRVFGNIRQAMGGGSKIGSISTNF